MKLYFQPTAKDLRQRVAAHQTRLDALRTQGGATVLIKAETRLLNAANDDLQQFLRHELTTTTSHEK